MSLGPAIDELITALRVLPGVGPKSAQRMAFHLLQRNRDGGRLLAERLGRALTQVGHCQRCRNLTDTPLCPLCADPRRARDALCVVESPADVLAVEATGGFRGRYFVLHGRLSPIDGVGPPELGMPDLERLVAEEQPAELILATNPTVEGEATAHFIHETVARISPSTKVTRIAHGVPLGGELEYVNSGTLSQALQSRQRL